MTRFYGPRCSYVLDLVIYALDLVKHALDVVIYALNLVIYALGLVNHALHLLALRAAGSFPQLEPLDGFSRL